MSEQTPRSAAAGTSGAVVVTGMGATTPLGGDVPSTWEAALAGRSGARPLTMPFVEELGLPVTFGGTLAVPATDVLPRHESKRLDPSAQYALIAGREAWAQAGAPEVEGERLGVVVATGIGGVTTLIGAYDVLRERGPRRVLPLTVPMLMPNGAAGALAIEFGAQAGAHSPASACASGAEAIAYAAEMIRTGRADVVIAGGTEAAILALPIAAFASMHALSLRNDTPETASRPYDVTRDGFVLAEGAGVVVLESEAHAAARGARVLGTVAGAGITSDAHHIAAPDPEGLGATRAMRLALQQAGAQPSDVVHVNAHATSTPVGDVAEAVALRAALGGATDAVAVSATKSMTGHLLGGAGSLEAIFCLKALEDGLAPPTINVTELDPQIDLDVVLDEPRKIPNGPDVVALNNAFGFGGHNAALALTGPRGGAA
ncbi:beta-ketoacyl synthase [uncultured Pseudokineococcus sp.]|uniref:beta-ketoacyl-[acyl-carrier-protein] synthase family protein n=1 Tax=uncultured Pseudokineococcus sp. TaxID=1642928 RepID=UPI002635F7AB|nr:beta-ketoacyl-[acyl-carrier-protein] synthase family protein [uncultured Pseudokineococcus sp.]